MPEVFTNILVDFSVNLMLYKVLTDRAVKRHSFKQNQTSKDKQKYFSTI